MSKVGKRKQISIMVSSAVYGQEQLLDMIFKQLKSLKYRVVMSCKGTVFANPRQHTVKSCIDAVQDCDLFLGIITTHYGKTKGLDDISVTHEEMRTAIKLKKPSWFLVQDRVIFAEQLLSQLKYDTSIKRHKLRKRFKSKDYFSDLRVIDMYEEAKQSRMESGDERVAWVQQYQRDEDVKLFIDTQFSSKSAIEGLLSSQTSVHENRTEQNDKEKNNEK